MSDPNPPPRPIDWARLRADEAERVIRERAEDTSRVAFGLHAFERLEERSITQPDAYDILRTGHVEGDPEKNVEDDWETIVVKRMPGGREAGVVTIIFRKRDLLFVKTVEWMDLNRCQTPNHRRAWSRSTTRIPA